MSADDMLAAQLWPWPDPIIKRDAQGGIIFVNAAFLQIYGGQVTDWHGCAVEGWPAPMPGFAPNRFETRVPSVEGEMIFDWLEYIMPDGGALAIARNVTSLLSQMPPQDPAFAPMPPMQDSVAHEAAFEPDTLPVHNAPNISETTTDAVNLTPDIEAAIEAAGETDFMADVSAPEVEEPPVQTQLEPQIQEFSQTEVTIEEAVTVQASAPTETRDHERRALPIENEESLLGANWRDAVIAKAVGAEEVSINPVQVAPNVAEPSAIAVPESPLEMGPNNNDGAIRILLAEDNAINALLTRTLLEADGCHVEVVEDGNLAVDAVRVNKYDMILMDMRMPNMDGLEATRKIRTLSNASKAIPIIALTANAFDDDRNACFDAGMNDFMTKPVSAEELQQMVQTWTSSSNSQAA